MSLAARSGVSEAMFGKGAPRCSVSPEQLAIGAHPEGAAQGRMEDVLLTAGEIVAGMAESPYAACAESSDATCFVYGLEAGAMDAVGEASAAGQVGMGMGFRCVWER